MHIRTFQSSSFILILFFSCCYCTFTVTNNCPHTIWPGTLAGSGTPQLLTTGFKLESGQSLRIPSTPGWSGRIWARTGCTFDASGVGKCLTGDCAGKLECDGSGATPPASLFEITLGKGDYKDFYDISLVDGYNLPIVAAPRGAFGACNATGCASDINTGCPKELQVMGGDGGEGGSGGVVACKSACGAFGLDQYCCSGQFANPTTCKPSFYSTIFKRACPRAYSYAFDDGTSTFTCKAYEYSVVFCPDVNGMKGSEGDLTPPTTQQPGGDFMPPTTTQEPGAPPTLTPPTTQQPGVVFTPPTTQQPGVVFTPPTLTPPTTQQPGVVFTPPTLTPPTTQQPNGVFTRPTTTQPGGVFTPPMTFTPPMIHEPISDETMKMSSSSNMFLPIPMLVILMIFNMIP
ncbi:hypothetical protein UlMin_024647 [Ulmus minor]